MSHAITGQGAPVTSRALACAERRSRRHRRRRGPEIFLAFDQAGEALAVRVRAELLKGSMTQHITL